VIRPNSNVNPAAGSAYAETTHGSSDTFRPTPAPITGSATFMIEKSTESMKLVPSSNKTASRCRPAIFTGTPCLRS